MNIAQVEADKAVLCSDHFDESCFVIGDDGERLMKANAVPSIFVFPDSLVSIIQNKKKTNWNSSRKMRTKKDPIPMKRWLLQAQKLK